MLVQRLVLWLASTVTLAPAAFSLAGATPEATPIRLVLQITVDGLRGDQLERFASGFGENGFRYLLDNGKDVGLGN